MRLMWWETKKKKKLEGRSDFFQEQFSEGEGVFVWAYDNKVLPWRSS